MDNPLLALSEYLTKVQTDYQENVAAADSRAVATPESKLENSFIPKFSLPSLEDLSGNPIANMGMDIAANFVQSTVQSMVQQALGKINGAVNGITSAAGGFMSAFSLLATGDVEIAMALARSNARLILEQLEKKDRIVTKLQNQVTALNNAVDLLLNSSPFFNDYLNKLILAYSAVDSSTKGLKSVVATLKGPRKFYNETQFNRSIQGLEYAVELILPDKTAEISQIQSGKLNDVIKDKIAPAKDGLAAALTIPGITLEIAKLMADYSAITLYINTLIVLFLKALNSYINGFDRSGMIDQMTISHIESAISQLDPVQKQMHTSLFPTDARKSKPQYPLEVMSFATAWGVQLSAIITWLKANPGRMSAELNLTAASVAKYNRACQLILAQSDIRTGLATLKVSEGQESVKDTVLKMTDLVTVANTAVATVGSSAASVIGIQTSISKKLPDDLRRSVREAGNLFASSRGLNASLKAALTPFAKEESGLERAATGLVGSLNQLASSLGFDRAASFIASADIGSIVSLSNTTLTFIGAGIAGIASLLSAIEDNPNATDEDKQKLQATHEAMKREETQKQVSASAGSANSAAQYKNDITKFMNAKEREVYEAERIALQNEVEGAADMTADRDLINAVSNLVTDTGNYLS